MSFTTAQRDSLLAAIAKLSHENNVVSLTEHWGNPSPWLNRWIDELISLAPTDAGIQGFAELLKVGNNVDSPKSPWGNPSKWLNEYVAAITAYVNAAGRVSNLTALPLVYTGHHTYHPYANNAPITFVADKPLEVASQAFVQYKFDKDASNVVNSLRNERAPVSKSSNDVRVGQAPGNYYSFIGSVEKSVFKGTYVNPSGEKCGDFATNSFIGDLVGEAPVVYAGTQDYSPYASNSPFLLATRGPLQNATQGVLVWSWDKDAKGNTNTNTAARVSISVNNNQIVILGSWYVFHGALDGNNLTGKFVNPSFAPCGTFKLALL